MAKKNKRSPSSNDFLLVPPPDPNEGFQYAVTPFGKNMEQQIENPGEWSAREERNKGPFGAYAEWTKVDEEGSDAEKSEPRKDRKR